MHRSFDRTGDIVRRLDQDDQRNFLIWVNHVRKAVNEGAATLKRREAAAANMMAVGRDKRRYKGENTSWRKKQGKKRGEKYNAIKEEAEGNSGGSAAGFCVSSEGGKMSKGTIPFKFAGTDISSSAAASAAFVLDHIKAGPTRTAVSPYF